MLQRLNILEQDIGGRTWHCLPVPGSGDWGRDFHDLIYFLLSILGALVLRFAKLPRCPLRY